MSDLIEYRIRMARPAWMYATVRVQVPVDAPDRDELAQAEAFKLADESVGSAEEADNYFESRGFKALHEIVTFPDMNKELSFGGRYGWFVMDMEDEHGH